MAHPSLIASTKAASAAAGGGYNLVEDEGAAETVRTTLNFVGGGVDVTDVGGKTQINIAGAAGGSATIVEVNLGSSPAWRGRFTITDAAIGATSKVNIWQSYGPYTGKGTRADESEMDWIDCHAIPAAGTASVNWRAVEGYTGQHSKAIGGGVAAAASTDSRVREPSKVIGRVRGNVKFAYVVY